MWISGGTVGPLYLQVPHPRIQPTVDGKYLEKKIPGAPLMAQ